MKKTILVISILLLMVSAVIAQQFKLSEKTVFHCGYAFDVPSIYRMEPVDVVFEGKNKITFQTPEANPKIIIIMDISSWNTTDFADNYKLKGVTQKTDFYDAGIPVEVYVAIGLEGCVSDVEVTVKEDFFRASGPVEREDFGTVKSSNLDYLYASNIEDLGSIYRLTNIDVDKESFGEDISVKDFELDSHTGNLKVKFNKKPSAVYFVCKTDNAKKNEKCYLKDSDLDGKFDVAIIKSSWIDVYTEEETGSHDEYSRSSTHTDSIYYNGDQLVKIVSLKEDSYSSSRTETSFNFENNWDPHSKNIEIYRNEKHAESIRFTYKKHKDKNMVSVCMYWMSLESLYYCEFEGELSIYQDIRKVIESTSRNEVPLAGMDGKWPIRKAKISISADHFNDFDINIGKIPNGCNAKYFNFYWDIRGGQAHAQFLDK